MFFGQKIHPLNFDGPDRLAVDADIAELEQEQTSGYGSAAPDRRRLPAAALRE